MPVEILMKFKDGRVEKRRIETASRINETQVKEVEQEMKKSAHQPAEMIIKRPDSHEDFGTGF